MHQCIRLIRSIAFTHHTYLGSASSFSFVNDTFTTASSSYTVPLTKEQCVDTRDALAKAVYSGLFDELIGRLNLTLGGSAAANAAGRSIGLLDIFGFENFAINGFEQLCINFTNETLQQHFTDALIKREQAEYAREGVKFSHITFPDNSAQIALLDGRSRGIFAMLDEEGKVPKGSDAAYVAKMHGAFAQHPHYAKPKFGAGALGKDLGEKVRRHARNPAGSRPRRTSRSGAHSHTASARALRS